MGLQNAGPDGHGAGWLSDLIRPRVSFRLLDIDDSSRVGGLRLTGMGRSESRPVEAFVTASSGCCRTEARG